MHRPIRLLFQRIWRPNSCSDGECPIPWQMQVNTDSAYRLIQLLDLLKEKDDEILELSKIVRMKDLEREKADLQVNPSYCHQSSDLIPILSSPFVCSLTCRVRRSNCWSRSLSESRQSGTSLNLHMQRAAVPVHSCDARFAPPFCPETPSAARITYININMLINKNTSQQ